MSSEIEQQENEKGVEWRRDKVLQLSSQGFSQREIASNIEVECWDHKQRSSNTKGAIKRELEEVY